jgi:hypothetical protein
LTCATFREDTVPSPHGIAADWTPAACKEDPAGLPYKLMKRKQMLIVETEKFSMKNSLISEKIMQKIWKIRINPIHLQG